MALKHPVWSRKSLSHWLQIGLLISCGVWAGDRLKESHLWMALRHHIYMSIHSLQYRDVHWQGTQVVLIGDDEYWGEELGGRVPVRRDYLARLVTALAHADASVIALDFDFRSPFPDGRVLVDPNYKEETEQLIAAIQEASTRCALVLPQTIGYADGNYTYEADIFEGIKFNRNVFRGYIALPYDPRSVPRYELEVPREGSIASFAQATVRARGRREWASHDAGHLPFGGFVSADRIPTVSAAAIAALDAEAMAVVRHQIVLIGADWHSLAYNRGRKVDRHDTPAGEMAGVLLHANYIEALLDGRVFRPLPEWFLTAAEVAFALCLGLIFAMPIPFYRKILWMVGLSFSAFGFSAVLLIVAGAYFDCFIPAMMILAHGTVEHVLEWRSDAITAAHYRTLLQRQASSPQKPAKVENGVEVSRCSVSKAQGV